jgi:ketosteroid isomerase-like protein
MTSAIFHTGRRGFRFSFAFFAGLLTAAVLLLPGVPLAAQIRPGIERGDYWGDVRARYRSEVLTDVGVVMEDWLNAWNNDDLEGASSVYTEDAALLIDEEMVRGEERVRVALGGALRRLGSIRTGLQDFDVSGDMAFATTTFRYQEGGGQVSGHMIWVLVRQSGSWRIRSQVFRQTR